VFLKVQDKFQNKVSPVLERLQGEDLTFRYSTKKSEDLAILIGDIDFLESESAFQQPSHQVILFNGSKIPVEQVYKVAQRSKLHFVDENSEAEIEKALTQIKSETNKQSHVLQVKNEIQKKRKELEQLNNQLISESERRIQFLEISHIKETEKNQNEKKSFALFGFHSVGINK